MIAEALALPFFQRALLAGLLASVAAGVVGTYVVVKRMASSLGMFGRAVATPEDLASGMADLFAHDGPGLLEIASSRLQY